MPSKVISWSTALGRLQPGMTVYAPGVTGESQALLAALKAEPDRVAGVRFKGVWLPGINRFDYAGLHADARATAFFMGSHLHDSFSAGRIDFLPLSYYETYRYLRDQASMDVAFIQVSEPDANGEVSMGIAHDFTPAVVTRARSVIAHVNSRMPPTRGGPRLAYRSIDAVIEEECPLLEVRNRPDPTFAAIGNHIASLLHDWDTIEVGVGRIQTIFGSLGGLKRLKIHSGAISSEVQGLIEDGVIDDGADPVTAGVALGDAGFYDYLRDHPKVRFAPVGKTHDIATLKRIERFIAINSVIEIDLLGQANAEMVGGRQIGGVGGLLDFMRGARLSPGGFSILALPATADGGTVSRIVSSLAPGVPVAVPRLDSEVVVTEHGVADLRHRSLDERAAALIAIAAPEHRDALATAWDERRRSM